MKNQIQIIPINTESDGTSITIKAQYHKTSCANFIRRGSYGATGVKKINQGDDTMERIRKLTPCECWRLQGFSKITKTEDGYEFDDTLFKRAESVNSNTQLYKQAGNSITVDILENLIRNLFDTEDKTFTETEQIKFTKI